MMADLIEAYSQTPEDVAREAEKFQRRADRRRIAEINARDERPWVVGLAILAVLAICAFVLAGFGLLA